MSETKMKDATPKRVLETLAFFKQHQLWSIVSRNSMATSCRDAVSRRNRLGKQGIPLYDELKSLCVVAHIAGGKQYVILHCRAHTQFDLEAAETLLKVQKPLEKLSAEAFMREFSTQYGTVNPFSEQTKFVHIFDQDILNPYTSPHTMMTNAGDLTWAIEFQPAQVIEALKTVAPRVEIANITKGKSQSYQLPSFGIITGNGPESGMALWRHINAHICNKLGDTLNGDLSYPHIICHSLPEMGLSMELIERKEQVWKVIEKAVDQLCHSQVTHITLACNTTPYFASRIRERCQQYQVEFVSIAETAINYIKQRNLSDLTIIGIPVVAEMGEYSAYQPLIELNVKPVAQNALEDLYELGYMIKRLEHAGQNVEAMNKLRHILRAGVDTSRVLIALTEISVFLECYPRLKGKIGNTEVIDPLRIYGEFLGQLYLNSLPEEEVDDEDFWGVEEMA